MSRETSVVLPSAGRDTQEAAPEIADPAPAKPVSSQLKAHADRLEKKIDLKKIPLAKRAWDFPARKRPGPRATTPPS